MSGTVFLAEGFELVMENGERKVKPKRPESWKHRTDGHRAAKKAWLCRACWWLHTSKPGICENTACQRTKFEHCASMGEARWLIGLVRRMERDEISELFMHPTYQLHAYGPGGLVHVCNYNADAEYVEKGVVLTCDFKPRYNPRATTKRKREAMLDPLFLLKRDWFAAEYGRPVTIVNER